MQQDFTYIFTQAPQLHTARMRVASQMRDADALQGKIDVVSKEVTPIRASFLFPRKKSAFCFRSRWSLYHECSLNVPPLYHALMRELRAGRKNNRRVVVPSAAGQAQGNIQPLIYNQFFLMYVKRAMASMQAEIRVLDAHVGLRTVLVNSEGTRGGCDAGEAMDLL